MAGVLAYTLALNGGGFNKTIGGALRSIGTLTVGFLSLRAIVDQTWAQIEKGGALVDLSNRTGAAVGDLYQLQEAFKVVGIDAGSVGGLLFKLQRSMSGFGEAGENTAAVFTQMGLSVGELQKMNAPQQIERIASAMKKLPSSQRAAMSAAIFGREGAANMVQLSRDLDGFNASLQKSAAMAQLFERSATAFDDLGDAVTEAKAAFAGLFAGIAEKVTPILRRLLDVVNADWIGMGQSVGAFVAAAFKSFENGSFTKLVSDSLRFGFETILDFAPGIFAKLGAIIAEVFKLPLAHVQSLVDYTVQGILLPEKDRQSPKDLMKQNLERGLQLDFGVASFNLKEVNQAADASIEKAVNNLKVNWEKFRQGLEDASFDYNDIVANWPKNKAKEPPGANLPVGTPYAPERTSLEKLGFVLNGGSGFDPAQRTATAAEKTANGIQTIIQKMDRPTGTTLFNAP